ncbi:MAG TPA: type II toxin-antitoxin system VapC family toxin [Tepidisphaeraceae bacterium]|nr:type II toxin-antitoxin system VapC family toxin [Tepidisphaeraceae bacterium]
MPLDLLNGTSCFVDSNILYYTLVPTAGISQPCLALVDRAFAGEISFSVSIPVLSDAVHRVMVSEAAQLTGRDRSGIVGYLGRHPELIMRLIEYPQAIDRLSIIPMRILPLEDHLLRNATALAVQHGLLTNDRMIVALMRQHQLTHLVTNDDDFDRVPGVIVWKPR